MFQPFYICTVISYFDFFQILQQRIQSAKHRAGLKRQSTITSDDIEYVDDEYHLKIPPDVPPLDLTTIKTIET